MQRVASINTRTIAESGLSNREGHRTMTKRPITLEQAKARYVHRFTMEHVPAWARLAIWSESGAKYHAPQFNSDQEWYDKTLFHGESELATLKHCYTSGQTWPLGRWLNKPFKRA